MENRENSYISHQFWELTQNNGDDGGQTGSQYGQNTFAGFTSVSRILNIERAGRAVSTLSAERLCAVEKARRDAVLERLGLSVQDTPLPSPRPPSPAITALPSRSTRSSRQGQRLVPLLHVPRSHVEDIEHDHHSFWDQVLLGSQMAVCAIKNMTDREESLTGSLSSADTSTPTELRAISLIEDTSISPTPPPSPRPVPLPRRRPSRLPVFSSRLSGADKEVANGCRLQTAKNKVEAFVEILARFQVGSLLLPRPPAAPKRTPAEAPQRTTTPCPKRTPAPYPKRTPAETPQRTPVPCPKRTPAETPQRTLAPCPKRTPTEEPQRTPAPCPKRTPAEEPQRTPAPCPKRTPAEARPGKKTGNDCSPQTVTVTKVKKLELQPLTNPVESLSACFKLLSSDDWMKEIEGLKIIQALAQHHAEILRTKLHEVCLVIIEQVKNLRSAVACAAMNTIAELYDHLQRAMDPEVEGTGRALLLKLASTTNNFIHQQANLALDAMVANCSHSRILSALLNTGLSHRCAAVRASMAQHLHQLADCLGAAHVLTAGKTFTERFLLAVSKMCVDGAPEVRHHGKIVLLDLAHQRDVLNLWTKIIPEKDRSSLDKILKKAK